MGINVTRFPNGVSTSEKNSNLGLLPYPDSTKYHIYNEDFNYFNVAAWTVTETQAGATQALGNIDGGAVVLANTAADDDVNAIVKNGDFIQIESGKELFFKALISVNDATQSEIIVGLTDSVGSPFAATDGLFISKVDGTDSIDLVALNSSVETRLVAVGTLPDAEITAVGFYYDGSSTVTAYVNDVQVGSLTVSSFTSSLLTVALAVRNGEAAAKNLAIDQVFVAKER